jgi:hypothetical protein
METVSMFIVVSKINNTAKVISATDKYHAQNKALIYFADHTIKDLKVLNQLKRAL